MIGLNENAALPNGWHWTKLGEVCEIIAGQSPPGETYRKQPEGLPFFQGKADFGLRHPIARTWCASPSKIAQEGDILISVRAPVGPTNVADVTCCIGRGLAAIRPKPEADRDFILAALKYYEPDLAKKGSGSTFAAINRNDLAVLPLPLPPLPEQERIAAILTEQMAAVEKARAASVAQLEAAKALPAGYLRDVFEGEQAKTWPEKRLGDVLTLRKEIVHPRDNPSGAASFVGLEHIQSGTGLRIGQVDLEMATLTGRKPKFHKGDIVYGYLRPYLNKLWIAEFDGLCSVDQYVYSVASDVADAEFVASFMRSPTYLSRAPIENTPGQLPRIRTEEVASVKIGLPTLPEQHKIIGQLNLQAEASARLTATLKDQLLQIEKLPIALLRQAFNGQL